MLGELRKQGLETLDLADQPFDPNVAEPCSTSRGDGGDTVVAEVLRTRLHVERAHVLRPAMVKVEGLEPMAAPA